MKTIWRSLRGAIQQFFGVGYHNHPEGQQTVRWTLAERTILPLAVLLIVLPLILSYLPGRGVAPAAARGADVTINKSASPSSVSPSDTLAFSIQVTNNTTATITQVRVDDLLSEEIGFVDVNSNIPGINCSHNGSTVSCQQGHLDAGQGGVVTI